MNKLSIYLLGFLCMMSTLFVREVSCYASDDNKNTELKEWPLNGIVNSFKNVFSPKEKEQHTSHSKSNEVKKRSSSTVDIKTTNDTIIKQLNETLNTHRETQKKIGEWIKKLDKQKASTKRTQKIYLEVTKELDELEILLIDRPTTKQETKKHIITIQKLIKKLENSMKESLKEHRK